MIVKVSIIYWFDSCTELDCFVISLDMVESTNSEILSKQWPEVFTRKTS